MCPKCSEVSERLVKDGLLEKVNYIAIADSQDADSEGMQMAKKYKIDRAPFFLVEDQQGVMHIFDVYFKFKRFVHKQEKSDPNLVATA